MFYDQDAADQWERESGWDVEDIAELIEDARWARFSEELDEDEYLAEAPWAQVAREAFVLAFMLVSLGALFITLMGWVR